MGYEALAALRHDLAADAVHEFNVLSAQPAGDDATRDFWLAKAHEAFHNFREFVAYAREREPVPAPALSITWETFVGWLREAATECEAEAGGVFGYDGPDEDDDIFEDEFTTDGDEWEDYEDGPCGPGCTCYPQEPVTAENCFGSPAD